MTLLYLLLIIVIQIFGLNALIAFFSESLDELNVTRTATFNILRAKLMVEYMDCWEGIVTRKALRKDSKKLDGWMVLEKRDKLPKPLQWWLHYTNGTLLELELRGLWTHKLEVSDKLPVEESYEKKALQDVIKDLEVTIKRDFVVAKRDREKLEQQLNDLKSRVQALTHGKVQRGSSHASINNA